MNWGLFIFKLPAVISGIMTIIDKVKAPGAEKKAAVLAAIPESIALAEFAIGKDFLDDPTIAPLVSSFIDATAAALKAKAALQAAIAAKAAVAITPVPTPTAPPG